MGSEGTYRSVSGGSGDAAAEALAELSRRAGRARLVVFTPFVVLGVALIVPAYWAAQVAQWELFGVAWALVSGAVAAVPLVAGLALGRKVTATILRARVPALERELAHRYGISEQEVADLAAMFIT